MTFLRGVPIALFTMVSVSFSQQQPLSLSDLNQILGKHVMVGRTPLCEPGTYTPVLSYAGKRAQVLSIKPLSLPPTSAGAIQKLPPQTRAMLEDEQKAGVILFQFDDGKKLDTCAPIGPAKMSEYLELAPGEAIDAVRPPPTSASSSTPIPTVSNSADTLSDEEVARALSGEGRDHWVVVWDKGLMAAQGNQVPEIELYMPEALIAIKEASSKKQFTRYEPLDEDKRRALTIVARGYAGKTIAEGCTSITRITLVSDPSGMVVREAYLSEPISESWVNNFGARNECQALRAKFSLDDVRKVRAAAPDGEFLVAVFSGSVRTKMYKIKAKHQSKLRLDASLPGG